MQSPLLVVEFIVLKNPAQLPTYLQGKQGVIQSFGGKNQMAIKIDQIFAGGEMPYEFLIIDQFSNREKALEYDKGLLSLRKEHLVQRYAFLVRSNTNIPKRVKRLHFLSSIFTLIMKSGAEKPIPNLTEITNASTSPTQESIAELRTYDQSIPFYMMNLNKFNEESKYEDHVEISGERAYNIYSKHVFPLLISVKAYPRIYGKIIEFLENDHDTELPDQWNDFILVYYPSRKNFLRLMTNVSMKATVHRHAGLERAVLMPCSVSNQFQLKS